MQFSGENRALTGYYFNNKWFSNELDVQTNY